MAGYGLAPYGIGMYGYATPPPSLTANVAWAVGDRTVRVKLSAEPLHSNPTVPGDALNPTTWEVVIPTIEYFSVISVVEVDAFTYDIRTLGPFPSYLYTLTVRSDNLLTVTGYPFPLLSLEFSGCNASATSTAERQSMSKGYALKDLLNKVGAA